MRDITELNNILDDGDDFEDECDCGLLCDGACKGDVPDAAYFNAKADGAGISGDDVNRRLREKRLGFKAPSDDWAQAHLIVRAIYPGQWLGIDTKTMTECIVWDMAGIRALHVVTEPAFLGTLDDDEIHDFNSDPCETCTTICGKWCNVDEDCKICPDNMCINCENGSNHSSF